ncbi:DUF4249 domain-containing protein [Mucilaginibacter galii]
MMMGAFACKERFNPPEVDTNLNYLTVEGLINTSGVDSTIIRVNRTVKLTSKVAIQPELKAILTIESNDNLVKRTLVERSGGIYYALPFALDATKQYRLRIRTSGGKEYLSDYTEVKVSPPIDAVGFEAQTNGVQGLQVYTNTHDATNKSRYYKWDFVETYKYNTNNFSSYIVDGRSIRQRNLPGEDIYYCWRTINSSNIVLASTLKLTNDVVAKAPIKKIPPGDERLGIRYSIIVNQQVLTKDAFDFWEILRKNTEQVGSIFDSQPSQLQGNIHAVSNPAEIVIGYISAGTIQRKRIFIDAGEVPVEFRYRRSGACPVDTILPKDYASTFYSGGQIPLDALTVPPSPTPIAYTTSSTGCIDCRLRGTNIQPAFWQ